MLKRANFAAQMGDRRSSFLAHDLTDGHSCILEGSDLQMRHAPWSTFKVPNTLIALETGVVSDIESWRDWDPVHRPAAAFWPDAWRQGQTLKTAFQRSAVWYYQDLALDVGGAQYRAFLTKWNYGNADAPDRSDTFWLQGPLKLSVAEQVQFLERMVAGHLDVQRDHVSALMAAAHAGPLGDATLFGKTGAGPVTEQRFSGAFEGWYVGWLTQGDQVTAVFAHHAVGPYFQAIRTYRKDFAETLLAACNLTDAQD
ncbi:penicillin-binding transpeptidase domain-containing protein [uncultured Tateyamaria sp.]|uniref:penicillin-binding transpeptidase domain-containing protein n=1 Tax=uncultured Tateyamaria sp. TaxID=455651 RepID=UPI0026121CD9|nr:penicillin-binding transpeptidase domain-containing protein [uncultured Tateyamaria sp.]